MIYHVTHTTTYDYGDTVPLCQNLAHLTPRDVPRQKSVATDLVIRPHPAVITNRVDYFGNSEVFFTIQESHHQLTVTASHVTEVAPFTIPDPARSPPWEQVRDRLSSERDPEVLEAYQYAFDSPCIPTGKMWLEYAAPSFPPGRPFLEGVLDLTRRIHADFRFDPRATTVSTPLREVLANRRGVCQDFAHLEIACLRSLGLAARYISGYLVTRPPPGKQRLQGVDASHAWLSVFCPGTGWIDLDPTNNQVPSDEHIVLAWGRDFDDVTPIKGVILGGGSHTVAVSVDVVPTGGS